MSDGLVRAISCSECRQVMITGLDSDSFYHYSRKVFVKHNSHHKFVPSKGRLNIVLNHIVDSEDTLKSEMENSLFSIHGYTLVEQLAGLS